MWCLKCIMGDTLGDRGEQNQKEEVQSESEPQDKIEARESL